MKELKGTKTEANLQAAFAGESMARNKYTYYASKARKDGYEQIASLFEETAGLPCRGRETGLQQTILRIQELYGKNALLRGSNLLQGAMTRERNRQVGGHRA